MENNEKWIMNADNTLSATGDIKTYKFSDFVYKGKKICQRCYKRLTLENFDYCQKCKDELDKIEDKSEETDEMKTEITDEAVKDAVEIEERDEKLPEPDEPEIDEYDDEISESEREDW